MIVNRITVIRRLVHVGEGSVLIQPLSPLFPQLMRGRRRHLDVHGVSILAIADGNGPAGGSTASWASLILATCSTVGFFSLSMSPFSALFSIVHWTRLGSSPVL